MLLLRSASSAAACLQRGQGSKHSFGPNFVANTACRTCFSLVSVSYPFLNGAVGSPIDDQRGFDTRGKPQSVRILATIHYTTLLYHCAHTEGIKGRYTATPDCSARRKMRAEGG